MPQSLPQPTPETQFYWDKAALHELWLQRCVTTGRFVFYPRAYSPYALGGGLEWVRAQGTGTLYSYSIVHRPVHGFEHRAPYAVAVVELSEGPRMMSNIVGIENTPENLKLDMPLEVDFEEREGFTLPVFRPSVRA